MSIVFIDFQNDVNDLNVSANECPKILLNVDENAKIVIESELRSNVRFLAPMNVSSRYWSPFHRNECVFSRNGQQKVYLKQFSTSQNRSSSELLKKKNTIFFGRGFKKFKAITFYLLSFNNYLSLFTQIALLGAFSVIFCKLLSFFSRDQQQTYDFNYDRPLLFGNRRRLHASYRGIDKKPTSLFLACIFEYLLSFHNSAKITLASVRKSRDYK